MNSNNSTSAEIIKLEKRLDDMQKRMEAMENVLYSAKDVLTLEEASVFMGITKSTLYKMTHENIIPFFKPNGKMIYFEKVELIKWIKQNRVASEEEIAAQAQQRLQELAKAKKTA